MSDIAPLKIMTPPIRYKAAGRCIYCDRRVGALSREHIIPYGIAGDSLILPKASCRRCAAITRDVETKLMRHLWWPFRIRIGAPTSGKQSPATFKLRRAKVDRINTDHSLEYTKIGEEDVDPRQFPATYVTPRLPPPGILSGVVAKDWELVAFSNHDENRRINRPGEGIYLGPLNPAIFGRFICKIAHGYIAGEIGIQNFEPLLQSAIRGHAPVRLDWYGGIEGPEAPSTSLHEISWKVREIKQIPAIIARVRLFAFLGAPTFQCVVGAFKGTPDQIPLLNQSLHRIDVETLPPIGEFTPVSHWVRAGRG